METQRSPFGRAVNAAIAASGKTKAELARTLDMDAANVNHWIKRPSTDPERWRVFRAEEFLGVPPGSLSRHLGYLPAQEYEPCTVEDALLAEVAAETLDQTQYEMLVAVYRSTRPRRARPGRQSA